MPIVVFLCISIINVFNEYHKGLILIAFFLPFERIGSIRNIFPIEIRLSQIFLIITLIAFIVHLIKNKFKINLKLNENIPNILLLIFILANIISLTKSDYLPRSIEILTYDIFTFLLFLTMPYLLQNKTYIKKIINTVLSISLILSLYGIFQFIAGNLSAPLNISGLLYNYSNVFFFHIARIQGTAIEPLYWSDYLLIPMGIALSIVLFSIKNNTIFNRSTIILSQFILILCSLNIILSFSRGAIYASGVMFIISAIIYYKRILRPKPLLILSTAIIGLTIIIGFLIYITKTPLTANLLLQRVKQVQDTSGRQLNSTLAKRLFLENKLLGVGVGGFGIEYNRREKKDILSIRSNSWPVTSNQYIEILAEIGILGLSTFTLFMAYIVIRAIYIIKKAEESYLKVILIGLILSAIGILIQYVSFSTLYIMHIWFLLGLINVILQFYKKSDSVKSNI